MVVQVVIPNLNNELTCLIRKQCHEANIVDYAVKQVVWFNPNEGFYRIVSGIVEVRRGFALCESYEGWNVDRVVSTEVM